MSLLLILVQGTSVRLILFFNSSHRHTRTASSYCKLHFPRETAASPKAKQNVITQEFEKYQKVWVLLQKSSASTNKCGAQTCVLIEMADGPIMGRAAVREGTVENKASAVTTTLHFCCFNKETGSGFGTRKFQTELIIASPVRDAQTDQFTVSSQGCLPISSSLLCFFYAVSLIGLGTEPHSWL